MILLSMSFFRCAQPDRRFDRRSIDGVSDRDVTVGLGYEKHRDKKNELIRLGRSNLFVG